MKPIISVIVPVFNCEKYIRHCVDSILGQTITDLELILVDDGAADQSGCIVDEYAKKDKRVLVIHQNNQGSMASRINGLSVASGEWISFIDSDDWIDETYYEKLLEEATNPCTDIIVSGVKVEGSANRIATTFHNGEKKEYSRADVIEEIVGRKGLTWSIVDRIFRRELFNDFILGERFDNGEDYITTIKLLKRARRLVDVKSNGYHYRLHMSSTSHNHKINDFADVQIEVLKYLDGYDEKCKDLLKKFAAKNLINKLYELWFDDYIVNNKAINYYRSEFLKITTSIVFEDSDYKKIAVWNLGEEARDNCLKTSIDEFTNEVFKLKERHSHLYLYGTGVLADRVSRLLDKLDIDYDGYVVSDISTSTTVYKGKNVVSIDDLVNNNQTGSGWAPIFVICVNACFVKDIMHKLDGVALDYYWPMPCEVHMY